MANKIVTTKYECSICERRFDTLEEAESCKAQGDWPQYPIGMLYGDHEEGAFYKEITFVMASNQQLGHGNNGSSWAFRDNGAGDSIGKNRCGLGGDIRLGKRHGKLNPEHPTFKRAVGYVRSLGLEPTVWDGEKPVSLSEYVSSFICFLVQQLHRRCEGLIEQHDHKNGQSRKGHL